MTLSKKFSTLLAGAVIALGLAACNGGADNQAASGGQPAAAGADTVAAIKEKGVIRIGVFGDKPPFGYVDANGKNQGFDVEIAKEMAKDLLGSPDKIEFVLTEAANRVEYIKSGKVDVLPDFSRILGADLIGLQRWLNLVGVKKLPRLGLGQDFHQLRDYQDGDDIRNIDWKATSRMSRPIVRTYQDEQDQQLIFLLDCGRNMRLQMEGKSHFDHALQAMLLLSYTALKHGDAAGLLTFAHPVARFVPPHKGMEQLGRLVQGVFDIEPSQQAADFESAVNLLLQKQKRRALVVVLSHLNHEDSRHLLQHIQRLRKHHMVLFGGLRPLAPEEVRQQPVRNEADAQAYLGALQYESHVAEAIRHFDAARINAINVLPNQLSTELINRYLQLKRRQAW